MLQRNVLYINDALKRATIILLDPPVADFRLFCSHIIIIISLKSDPGGFIGGLSLLACYSGRFSAQQAGLYCFTIWAQAGGNNGDFRIKKSDGTTLCEAYMSSSGKVFPLVSLIAQ